MKIKDIIKESSYRNKQRDILLQRIADADDPIGRAKLIARFEAQFPELYGRDQEGGVAQGMDQADEINSIAVAKAVGQPAVSTTAGMDQADGIDSTQERGAGYELDRAQREYDEYLKRTKDNSVAKPNTPPPGTPVAKPTAVAKPNTPPPGTPVAKPSAIVNPGAKAGQTASAAGEFGSNKPRANIASNSNVSGSATNQQAANKFKQATTTAVAKPAKKIGIQPGKMPSADTMDNRNK